MDYEEIRRVLVTEYFNGRTSILKLGITVSPDIKPTTIRGVSEVAGRMILYISKRIEELEALSYNDLIHNGYYDELNELRDIIKTMRKYE